MVNRKYYILHVFHRNYWDFFLDYFTNFLGTISGSSGDYLSNKNRPRRRTDRQTDRQPETGDIDQENMKVYVGILTPCISGISISLFIVNIKGRGVLTRTPYISKKLTVTYVRNIYVSSYFSIVNGFLRFYDNEIFNFVTECYC